MRWSYWERQSGQSATFLLPNTSLAAPGALAHHCATFKIKKNTWGPKMASRPRPSTFAIKVFLSEHFFYEKSRQWGKKRGRKKTRTKIVATNVVAWETAQTPTDWNAKSSCQYHRLPSRTRPICCAKTMTAKTYQNPLQDQDWERRDKTVSILNLQEETKTRLNSRLKARGSEIKSLSVFFSRDQRILILILIILLNSFRNYTYRSETRPCKIQTKWYQVLRELNFT